MLGLSLVAASGGHSSLRCAGLSLSWPLLLRSTGSRRAGSVVVAHGPNCSVACGIFPDQGSNPCPLHWQADSQPLRHQGSPMVRSLNAHSVSFISVALEPVQHILNEKKMNGHLSVRGRNHWLPFLSHKVEEGMRMHLSGKNSAPPPFSKESL